MRLGDGVATAERDTSSVDSAIQEPQDGAVATGANDELADRCFDE